MKYLKLFLNWLRGTPEFTEAARASEYPVPVDLEQIDKEWAKYNRTIKKHKDTTVRLHGGPKHGRIVELPPASVRTGTFQIPDEISMTDYFKGGDLNSTDLGMSPILTYRRKTLAWFDEVDNTVHHYDYWLLEGAPLPIVR